jgi:multidrug resistance protein, MATE family
VRSEILKLAAPTLVGQLALMLNGVIDTVMAGQLSAVDQAAVGLGASIYISVYLSFTGVLMALSPIAAGHFGAKRYADIGIEFRQTVMLALLLALPAVPLLLATPMWFAFASPPPEVASVTTAFLFAIAVALPANLLFRVYSSLNHAISQPKMVMFINLLGLALKVPLNALLMFGAKFSLLGISIEVPAYGGAGCAISTCILFWLMCIASYGLLRWDKRYQRYALWKDWQLVPERMMALIRLGVPIGFTFFFEITSFTFISLFLARFGATISATHQVASNLTALAFMVPLALSGAMSTLAAQAVGARSGVRARAAIREGLIIVMCAAFFVSLLIVVFRYQIGALYSKDPVVAQAAGVLLLWIAVYHLFDALQTAFAFGLRAFKVTTGPMIIYALSLWGLGLGLGAYLTFVLKPTWLTPTESFWGAGILGAAMAALALGVLSAKKMRAVIGQLTD